MRTALLAALDHGDDGALRAALMLGGRSVLARQGEVVRALGCERVICLTERFGEEILALQRMVEADGGEFHALRSGLQLPGIVRAEDELVVMLDGLVPQRDAVEAVVCAEGELVRGIVTLPASHPLAQAHPHAFERIDRDRSWAGVFVMRAAPVQQLADLPGDSATIPLLLRLALQAGTPCRALDTQALGEGDWLFATSHAGLAAREQAMVDSALVEAPWTGPGRALAQEIARRLAPRGLSAGPLLGSGAALVLLVLGAVLAGFGFGTTGLLLAVLGAFAGAWMEAAASLARGLLGGSRRRIPLRAMGAALDALAAAVLVCALLFGSEVTEPDIAEAALGPFAIGLARLAARERPPLERAFWEDRTVHLAVFASAAGLGVLAPVLALFGLVALVRLLLRQGRV
ncbi:hypothetical protein [Erythrobacter sp.]|uniref:hypothetical protein n=1 Tax=Erythrobacter sp. TaxID=1042 RepID=UPI001425BFE6|nr:hypothetical protein [Erythrobacter sp.]QIQ86003.1 MAG: hypothetical protein G9473_04375 [Erythrobacter sp.]